MLFDEIFQHIGDFGKSQIFLYSFLGFTGVPTAFHHVSITFLGAHMDHWCMVPSLSNLTQDQRKYIAIPTTTENGQQIYSHCQMYDVDYNIFTESELLSWNRSTHNHSQVSCTAWEYDRTVFTDTIVSQWDAVCNRSYLVNLVQSIYMAGVLVGCLGFGQLADRIGRKKTIVVASFFWGVSALIAAFSPSFSIFVTFRFAVGACAAGSFTTAFVMSMEVIGSSVRMETGINFQSWFAAGIMILPGLAYVIPNFVTLQVIIGVVPFVFISYYWLIPESPRWLVTMGRDKEAIQVLQQMAKGNGTRLPEDINLEENRIGVGQHGQEKAVLFDLFRKRKMRVITICMWTAWLCTSVVYYGTSLGVGYLGGSIFFNTFLVGLVELPSYVVSIFLLKKIGRRWPLIVTYFASALFSLLIIPFLNTNNLQPLLVTVLMLAKFFGAASFAILYVYAAELFPTVVRNVGVGSSSMAARMGGLIQPQIALLDQFWGPIPFLFYGAVSILGGVVSFVFPETLNKKLPETLEEAENFGRKPEKMDKSNESAKGSGSKVLFHPISTGEPDM